MNINTGMENRRILTVAILAIITASAYIGYTEFRDLYNVQRTEVKVEEDTYETRLGLGFGSKVYKGWVHISLNASREVEVGLLEVVKVNGYRYNAVETFITDRISGTNFTGPEYVAVEVDDLETYDDITRWNMTLRGPVERTFRPHAEFAVTLGYFSVLSWLAAGSWVALEASWEIYRRLGKGRRRGSG
jgi:hypothetical protein